MAEGRGRAPPGMSRWVRSFQKRHKATTQAGQEVCAHTTLYVEDVVLVQGPATEVGRVQLKALEEGRPLLPEDQAGAGLILEAHRHCRTKGGQSGRKERPLDLSRAPQ